MNRWHRRLLGGLGILRVWDRMLEALLTGEIYDRGFVRVHLEGKYVVKCMKCESLIPRACLFVNAGDSLSRPLRNSPMLLCTSTYYPTLLVYNLFKGFVGLDVMEMNMINY